MKKLIILLLLICSFAVNAKTYRAPANISEFGTAGDTIIASKADTATMTIASKADTATMTIASDAIGKLNLILESTKVSGAPNYSAVLSGSLNGVNYVALDTISYTGGGSNAAYFDLQEHIYKYYRVIVTANATAQKSLLKLTGIVRK